MLSLQKDASGKLFSLQRPPLLGGILGGSVKQEKFLGLILTEILDPLFITIKDSAGPTRRNNKDLCALP